MKKTSLRKFPVSFSDRLKAEGYRLKENTKKTLAVVGLAFILTFATAYAQAIAPTRKVTASEYAAFLNQNAATDPDHLYDEKMQTDPEVACILRLGKPGNYFYEVIAGKENFPVTYMSKTNKDFYCVATGLPTTETEATAENFIKSNRDAFSVAVDNIALLQMFNESATEEGVVELDASLSWEETVAFLTTLGAAFFGDEVIVSRSNESVGNNVDLGSVNAYSKHMVPLSRHTAEHNILLTNEENFSSFSSERIDGEKSVNDFQSHSVAVPPAATEQKHLEALAAIKVSAAEEKTRIGSQKISPGDHRKISGDEKEEAAIASRAAMIEMRVLNKIPATAKPHPTVSALTFKAFAVFIQHQWTKEEKNISYKRHQWQEKEKSSPEHQAVAAAEKAYFHYLTNARVDIGLPSSPIDPKGLAAISCAEEAWRFSIVAAKQITKRKTDANVSQFFPNPYNIVHEFFSEASTWMQHAARYYNNALAAERRGNQEVSAAWNQAASQYASPLMREAITLRYRAQWIPISELLNTNGKLLVAVSGDDYLRTNIPLLHRTATHFTNIANCMSKRIIAHVQNNQKADRLLRNALAHYEYANAISDTANHYHDDANNYHYAATALIEASKERAQGNHDVADLLDNAAKLYQLAIEPDSIRGSGACYRFTLAAENIEKAARALSRGDRNAYQKFLDDAQMHRYFAVEACRDEFSKSFIFNSSNY